MSKFVLILLALAALPNLTGCSLLFFAAGDNADRHAHDPIPLQEVHRLHPGDDIAVLLADSSTVEGHYSALEKISVRQGDSSQSSSYPITFLSVSSGAKRSGRLLGFDADTLWIQLDSSGDVSPFSMEKTREISNRQMERIGEDTLRDLAAGLPLQFRRTLIVSLDNGDRHIPVSEIKLLRHNKAGWAGLKMLAVGICFDAAIIGIGEFTRRSFGH